MTMQELKDRWDGNPRFMAGDQVLGESLEFGVRQMLP